MNYHNIRVIFQYEFKFGKNEWKEDLMKYQFSGWEKTLLKASSISSA